MKKFTPLLLTGLFASAILASCTKQDSHAGKTLTIYDTALMMFHEFVAESNDTNLGFSNADEVLKAHIAIDSGISMYILGKGLKLKEQGDSQELDLHIMMQKLSRMLYPVYVGNVLHAAITFDSTTEGWRPVMFENANVLIPYLLNMQLPSQLGQAWKNYYFVSSPDLHSNITIRHDSGGDYVLPTNDLKRTMAENYPNPNDTDLKPIKKEDFFEGLKKHIAKKEKEHHHLAKK
jgi:hypothetical protein